MLRRVGLAYRQHFEQAAFSISTTSNLLRNALFLRCPSTSIRCSTSVAASRREHSLRSSLSGIQTPGLNPDSSVVVNRVQDASAPKAGSPSMDQQPPLPVELLTTLLSRNLSENALLKEIHAIPSLSERLLDNTQTRQLAEAMALTSAFRLAVKVLHLAHILGCQLKQNAYECTAHHLATKLHWTAVLSVVSLGKRHTGKSTVRLLNWRIRALVETDQHAILRTVLEDFERFHVKPTRRTFHLLVSGHIRNRDLAGARKLLRLMNQIGLPPDESTHAIVASYYRSLGPNAQIQDQALRSIAVLEDGSAVAALNHLIRLRLDAHDPGGILQLLSVFDSAQVAVIHRIVSGVISTPGGGNPYASPLSEIRRTTPLAPNAETFAIFIQYMASMGDLSGALAIIESLTLSNIRPAQEIATSLIQVYFATGHSGAALGMVAEICKENPRETFASLAKAVGGPQVPLPFKPSGIVPTTRMFNTLLRGLLSLRGFDCVWDIFTIMQANNIVPNASTIEVLVAFAGKSQTGSPRMLLRFLNKLRFPELRPTLRHLHVLLSCVIRHERYLTFGVGWDATAALFSRTRQAKPRLRPNGLLAKNSTEPFDPIAGISLDNAGRRAVEPIIQRLSDQKINVDGVLAGLRLKREAALKVDMDAAQEIFEMLLARGIQPNEYHFSALMEGYTRAGDVSAAVDILKAAMRVGVKPNHIMYTILIVGYARQGQPEEAVNTFQRMVQADIQPDVASIDAVAGAFFAVGAYSMARRTLITLWQYAQPFPEQLSSAPLKILATEFRLLQGKGGQSLTKSQWRRLYFRLDRLLKSWKASQLP